MVFCPLYSGSSGNSIFVSSEHTKILIDAGLPGKKIEMALNKINREASEIDAIFITHEHSDHIKGVGVLSRRYDIPIYANQCTWEEMAGKLGNIKEKNIKIMDSDYVIINDMKITKYNISHDAVEPVGYTVEAENKKICVATDLGYFSDEVKEAISGADIVLLESNHDVQMVKFGPYPYNLKRRILSDVGHLSNDDCGKAIVHIAKGNCKRIILGHLSKTNNHPQLAYETVLSVLRENNVELNKDLCVDMAKRDMPSECIEL
ncbi:MBL fold metallo-hydrolase [Clostridium grantii]|uniref:Phosphoribosyl 1,2-cyclic phosphodiesterase n=1 Tax=Clostridium grantii DSM 8605 TaxID=1121316 RepID=A0A1M5W5L9_9CLOT|nr:MBL fold metallo-hydrolase [Clostridium grantii]SHH82822.1 Phosphoribosyl 1,2-cyclic phosphodiesterase [Clostridium grantii DSM 8605]